MKFGEKVRDLRKKNSLTQDELAKCLGVSKRTIIGWERDGRYLAYYFSPYNPKKILIIANAIKATILTQNALTHLLNAV